MDTERYDLIFKGELVPGADPAQVKQNLQQLFRIDAAQVEKLFAGKPVPLKRGLDFEAANKYRVALKKAGARLDVVPCEVTAAQPAPASHPQSASAKASALVPAPAQGSRGASAGAEGAIAARASAIEAPDYGVAVAGSDLLREEEKPKTKPVQVDVSSLSVAPMAGNLLAEHERAARPKAAVAAPQFDVLPPGSDVLKEDERQVREKVEVDTSGLSVAELGVRLEPPRPAPPAAPSVDHIRLERH